MSDSKPVYHSYGNNEFEWHGLKAVINVRKHGVTFEEAATIFEDERAIVIDDPDHSEDEDRFLLLGKSAESKLLVVVSVERGPRIRLISARPADRQERRDYDREGRVGV